jgi:hypothetical protein
MINTAVYDTMNWFMWFMIIFALVAAAGVLYAFKWGDKN